MVRRVYEERRNGILHRVELAEDGAFVYTEEEERIHGDGASASGRWTTNGAVLTFEITESTFQRGWQVGTTVEAPYAVTLGDVTLRLRSKG